MVKTIKIRDEVYRKLLSTKRKDESFSELLDRLAEKNSTAEILKKIRGSVEFGDSEKEELLSEIRSRIAMLGSF
ncbi:MAG: antitoxin VapB family protein [Candidatus Bathyarchaeia archaeon]